MVPYSPLSAKAESEPFIRQSKVSCMLRISKLADYATMIMSRLAQNAAELCSASLLSKNLNLSLPVVSKILKILCQAGLLTSVRGVDGGYRLAKPAQEITLAAVVSAMEGDLAMTECCSQNGGCVLEGTCAMKKNWQVINGVISAALGRVTIQDMVAGI